MERKDNFVDWAGVSAESAMSSCSHVDVVWSGCCSICAAGTALGVLAFTSHIRAMSCRLSQLVKGLAARTVQLPNGESAACKIMLFSALYTFVSRHVINVFKSVI